VTQLLIERSYVLDLLNFVSVMTGDEFYTSRHELAYETWRQRLSESARRTLAAAVADYGSGMIGPVLSLLASAVPEFEVLPVPELLANTDRVHRHFAATPYYDAGSWAEMAILCGTVSDVVRELEELGFRNYWETERLPLIQEAEVRLTSHLQVTGRHLGEGIAALLGPGAFDEREDITLFLCSFAAPHGIKICGKRFISDVRYDPQTTLRIAAHEMFHPPYKVAEVDAELQALINTPLFRDAFSTKDPQFGYDSELGFLEENVVEAASLVVCKRQRIVPDPVGYLAAREGGVYKVGVVLFAYFDRMPKRPEEPFATFFKRVVAALPLGHLEDEYQRIIDDRC
jgi:hypothetical protein